MESRTRGKDVPLFFEEIRLDPQLLKQLLELAKGTASQRTSVKTIKREGIWKLFPMTKHFLKFKKKIF